MARCGALIARYGALIAHCGALIIFRAALNLLLLAGGLCDGDCSVRLHSCTSDSRRIAAWVVVRCQILHHN